MTQTKVSTFRTRALRKTDQWVGAEDGDGFAAAVSCLLTPWKLAATAIEMRLSLKQLAEGLLRDATRHAANASLDRLGNFVFHQCKSAEEVDFVAEMMTEVSRDVAGKVSQLVA